MSGDTTTTYTNIMDTVVIPNMQSVLFRNSAIFQLSPPKAPGGGSNINWPVQVAGTENASTYAEGDVMNASNTVSIQEATVDKQPFQVTAKISKIALDYLKDNEINLASPQMFSIKTATENLIDTVNTTLLATLEAAIDSAGTYAGINRSTYAAWASYEESTSTALTEAHLEDMLEALLDNDRACNALALSLLAPHNQCTNLSRLVRGAQYREMNGSRDNMDTGRLIDSGGNYPPWNGIPVIGIPDMTNTVLLMIELARLHVWETRPVTADLKDVLEDALVWNITCNYQLTYDNTQKAGKLSAKTA